MLKRVVAATMAAILLTVPAFAHGGGGAIYVPIYAPPPTVPGAEQVGAIDKIHTVAVISAIGQHLTVGRNGWTSDSKSLDISDWKLDDLVIADFDALSKGRFAFKDVPYDARALAAIPNGPLNNSKQALKSFLGALPGDGVDAFIVIRPDLEYGAPGSEGLGIEADSNLFGEDFVPVAWVNFEIDVVDAHTLEIIGKAYSRAQVRQGGVPSFAGFALEKSFSPGPDLGLSDPQRDALRRIFGRFVHITLVETLRVLGLGLTLPDVGARVLLPIPDDKNPFASIKTVAIASAIGDEMDFRHVATILFKSDAKMSLKDWTVDHDVADEVQTAISKHFTVKDVPVDAVALAQMRLIDDDGHLLTKVSALQPSSDVDAYIVVVKQPMALSPGMSGAGLGAWRNAVTDQTILYASYAIALVDAHSLKILEAHVGVMPPTEPEILPCKAVDSSLWPDSPQTATPDQLAQIRHTMFDLLAHSVPETLLQMLLTDQIAVYPTVGSAK
jgi:hypothetical protein